MFGSEKKATPAGLAREEIARYGERERQLVGERAAKLAELAQAERAAGEAYLDGNPEAANAGALKLRVECDTLARALEACRMRRAEALRKLVGIQVQDLRSQAVEKQRELDDLKRRTGKHLAALTELEGVPHVAVGLARSAALESAIADLQRQAAELERRGVPTSGTLDVQVTSTEQALASAARYDGIIPPLEAIQQWAGACEARSREAFGDRQRRLYLVWRDGTIDREQSYIYVGDFARVEGKDYFDTAKGSFKAAA